MSLVDRLEVRLLLEALTILTIHLQKIYFWQYLPIPAAKHRR